MRKNRISQLRRQSASYMAVAFFIGLTFATMENAIAANKDKLESEAATYGELLLIEKKTEKPKGWQAEVSGMQEFSNPYLNISGVSAAVKKSVGSFVYIGPEYTRYFSSVTDVNRLVTDKLKSEAISQNVYEPRSSVYGVVSVIPVSGYLNVFNTNSIPVEMEVSLGYGSVQYNGKDSAGSMLWRLGPRAFFSSVFGMQVEFGQEIESPFSSSKITKSHARLGFITRF